jgi:hypothetical protein
VRLAAALIVAVMAVITGAYWWKQHQSQLPAG